MCTNMTINFNWEQKIKLRAAGNLQLMRKMMLKCWRQQGTLVSQWCINKWDHFKDVYIVSAPARPGLWPCPCSFTAGFGSIQSGLVPHVVRITISWQNKTQISGAWIMTGGFWWIILVQVECGLEWSEGAGKQKYFQYLSSLWGHFNISLLHCKSQHTWWIIKPIGQSGVSSNRGWIEMWILKIWCHSDIWLQAWGIYHISRIDEKCSN